MKGDSNRQRRRENVSHTLSYLDGNEFDGSLLTVPTAKKRFELSYEVIRKLKIRC